MTKNIEYAANKLAELKQRIRHLEREADWLAKRFNTCPVDVIGIAGMCVGVPKDDKQCVRCWREAARRAVKDASS